MSKIIVSLCFTLTLFVLSAQKYEDRLLVDENSSWQVRILKTKTNINSNDTTTYYWVKGTNVYTTQGAVEGYLIDGPATRKYRNGQLYEKGYFRAGKKQGVWRIWDEGGMLLEKSNWKNGRLNGEKISYDKKGNILLNESYKRGKLHGKVVSGDKTLHYKNGEIIIKQPKDTNRKEKETEKEQNPELKWYQFKKKMALKKENDTDKEEKEKNPTKEGKRKEDKSPSTKKKSQKQEKTPSEKAKTKDSERKQ